MADSCPVCVDPYTDVKRLKVTCAYCDYEACQTCYRTYILGSTQDAHCMSCRKAWTHEFLAECFPTSWLHGAYKKHRETILIEREKQLLPDSQPLVANFREATALRKGIATKMVEMRAHKQEVTRLANEMWADRHAAERLEHNRYHGFPGARDDEARKRLRRTYIAPCPSNDCRGFLNDALVCGTCAKTACSQCGVLLAEDHECVPDEVASFKALRKETRPCPNPSCAVATYKISGCDQMWCVMCHTTWLWSTGEVDHSLVQHNPHMFAYLRERANGVDIPRQPGDVPCGDRATRFPNASDVSITIRSQILRTVGIEDPTEIGRPPAAFNRPARQPIHHPLQEPYDELVLIGQSIMTFLRGTSHLDQVEAGMLRHRIRDADNSDLRLKFLINELTEEQFRNTLQRREKRHNRDVAVRDIYQMVIDTTRDAMWALIDGAAIRTTHDELHAIRTYANTNLMRLRDKFKMAVSLV